MNKKRLCKAMLVVSGLVLMSNINSFATEEVAAENPVDMVAPVFDSNIQTRYVLQGNDDGKVFIPEDVIKGITATDDVDGKNVTISVLENSVDLSKNGQYYVSYTATDKSGNISYMSVTVIVDKTAPIFAENTENLYYINSKGIILDSNHQVVENLPEKLVATDSVGAYEGIGVYMYTDENSNIVFAGTVENSPAVDKIQSNDILIGVNGEDVQGQTPSEVAKKIKGEPGTSVELRIIRNGQEMNVSLERNVVKLYEDEEFEAIPNVEVTSIDTKSNGVIEITYTATDEAGNTSEFVVTVVVDLEEPEPYIDEKKTDEEEALYMVTTGDNPPEEDLELVEDTEIIDEEMKEDSEDEVEEKEDKNVEFSEEISTKETDEEIIEEVQTEVSEAENSVVEE